MEWTAKATREFRRDNDDRRRSGFDLRQQIGKKGRVSFFVSRIPEKWNSKSFLTEMKKKGPVTEAFVISKRDKHGLRFGFARFEVGIDVDEMTMALRQLEVDGVRLFAKLARFDRNGVDTMPPQPQNHQRTQVWQSLGGSDGRRKDNISFVEMVKGKETSSGKNQKDTGEVRDNMDNPKSKPDHETQRGKTGESEGSMPGHTEESSDNQNKHSTLENQLISDTLQKNGDKRGIQEELVKEKGDTGDYPEINKTSEVQQTVEAPNTQDEPDMQKPWFKIDTEGIEDPMENLETRYVAEVKQFQVLTCIKNIVLGEDYGYGTVQYLGGLWVLLSFIS